MTDQTGVEPAGRRGGKAGYRRFLGTGVGAGVVGGLCCLGSALAVGAGLGGLSFFITWMQNYHIYFILAGLAIMAAWLVWQVRNRRAGQGPRDVLLGLRRQLVAMGGTFVVTVVVANAIARLTMAG